MNNYKSFKSSVFTIWFRLLICANSRRYCYNNIIFSKAHVHFYVLKKFSTLSATIKTFPCMACWENFSRISSNILKCTSNSLCTQHIHRSCAYATWTWHLNEIRKPMAERERKRDREGKCRANKTNKNIREVASINNLSRYKQRSEIAITILHQSIKRIRTRKSKQRGKKVWSGAHTWYRKRHTHTQRERGTHTHAHVGGHTCNANATVG